MLGTPRSRCYHGWSHLAPNTRKVFRTPSSSPMLEQHLHSSTRPPWEAATSKALF